MNYQYPYGYMPSYYNPNNAAPDMLNQYKMPYQQNMAPQMPQQVPSTAPQVNDGMIWVQGLEGAKSYLVAPNTTVVLWDTESSTLYIKSADSSGKPNEMKILDFVERDVSKNAPQDTFGKNVKFVTVDELQAVESKIEELTAKCEPLFKKQKGDGE